VSRTETPSPQSNSISPQVFKGIALFTPGGDLVYCIDPQKQVRWHIHLCGTLQHLLGLAEPPHFLVPCYTATVDRSIDPRTKAIQQVGEASSLVLRYQPLLNSLFGTEGLVWHPTPGLQDTCDPIILATYRAQYPQLWQSHDLVIRYDQSAEYNPFYSSLSKTVVTEPPADTQGYVLRLFVSGHSLATERTLQRLHHLLEQLLNQPYTLKVVDVSQHPEEAELHHVAATPTLVRVHPLPVRRIVGNLDHLDHLLGVLQLPND
jgi:circadian clock protein KaiB